MPPQNPAISFLQQFRPASDSYVDLHTLFDAYGKHVLQEADAYSFPVNIHKVFRRYKLRTRGDELPRQRGAITPDLEIIYNASDPIQVQIFTKAHELVEPLALAIVGEDAEFDPEWLTLDQAIELAERKEEFCEYGAASILMPMSLFKPYVESYGFSMRTAQALARNCGLSLTAIARRMLNTELRQAAFIDWQYRHKPSESIPSKSEHAQLPLWSSHKTLDPPKKLRVDRWYTSPTMREYVRKHKSVNGTTAIAHALQSPPGSIIRGYDYLEICKKSGFYLTESIPAGYDGQLRVMSFIYFDDQAEQQYILESNF